MEEYGMLCFGPLFAAEWEYLGEGNAHLVCRYRPSRIELTNPLFEGKVLRLAKAQASDTSNSLHLSSTSTITELLLNPFFGNDILLQSTTIEISKEFLSRLSTLIYDKRPSHRREKDLNFRVGYGELFDDATKRPNTIPRNNIDIRSSLSVNRAVNNDTENHFTDVVTIELKVKCGMKGSSVFIPKSRDLKRRYGRYHIMQQYKMEKKKGVSSCDVVQEEGSVGEGAGPARYDPCDLCSGSTHRIRAAVLSLLADPQNNLIISINGTKCFGGDAGNDRERVPDTELLVIALSAILSEDYETVLQRLQHLQSFDAIDTEGAACVFGRLESLTGSRELAERAIHTSFMSAGPSLLQRAESALASMSGGHHAPHAIESLKKLQLQELDLEEQCAMGMRLVNAMSAEECVEVLQLWLLSWTAKDASLMVSLCKVPASDQELAPRQRGTGRGTVQVGQTTLAYSLRLVDMGIKPPSKCWSVEERETRIFALLNRTQSINSNSIR